MTQRRHTHRHKRDSSNTNNGTSNNHTHKHVWFSHEPPTCHVEHELYYPRPDDARPLLPTNSLRRFAVDEVELLFSAPLSQQSVTPRDYAVHAIRGRDDFLACGVVTYRKQHVGSLAVWRTCWAELYHGVLMLRQCKDPSVVAKKRTLVPIADCELTFVRSSHSTDSAPSATGAISDDHMLALTYTFQNERKRRVVRFASSNELFLWYWAIRIAAQSPVDGRVLHKSMSRPALSPQFFLATAASAAESVFLPHALVQKRPTPGVPPSSVGSIVCSDALSATEADKQPLISDSSSTDSVMHLLFVRHGEAANVPFRVRDAEKPLTPRGCEQATLTANWLAAQLTSSSNNNNVTLISGSLQRCQQTTAAIADALALLDVASFNCCLLDEGAPLGVVTPAHRTDNRDAMHALAFEHICRVDSNSKHCTKRQHKRRSRNKRKDVSYKIVVCHASFIQFVVAKCFGVTTDVITLGAPIAHCSVTQIDVRRGDVMDAACTNRVTHLPLTHRTSD